MCQFKEDYSICIRYSKLEIMRWKWPDCINYGALWFRVKLEDMNSQRVKRRYIYGYDSKIGTLYQEFQKSLRS